MTYERRLTSVTVREKIFEANNKAKICIFQNTKSKILTGINKYRYNIRMDYFFLL